MFSSRPQYRYDISQKTIIPQAIKWQKSDYPFWIWYNSVMDYVSLQSDMVVSEQIQTTSTSHPLFRAIIQAQERYWLFPIGPVAPLGRLVDHDTNETNHPVVIGVSGGADSVCLFHLLRQFARQWRLDLHVAHLDHGLRLESSRDAIFVAELARQFEIPSHIEHLPPEQLHQQLGGIEHAARRARYRFLCRIAESVTSASQQPIIAVAHHADDQTETLLLNMLRGSGLRGLGGMRCVTEFAPNRFEDPSEEAVKESERPIRLIRPLLFVERTAIIDYLQSHDLSWVEDDSNQELIYLRNRIRHQVLPMLKQIQPQIATIFGQTAQIVQGEIDRTQNLDRELLTELTLDQSTERIVLDYERLIALRDIASQRGILCLAIAEIAGDLQNVEFQLIKNLLAHLKTIQNSSGPHPLMRRIAWTLTGSMDGIPSQFSLHATDALPIIPAHPYLDRKWLQSQTEQLIYVPDDIACGQWALRCRFLPVDHLPADWQRTDQPWRAYIDTDHASSVVLTVPSQGLRFAPVGLGGKHKKVGDFFTDQKVPVYLRSQWPIIIDAQTRQVVWICGLRLAHHVRITEKTTQVLCLEWRKLTTDEKQ